MTTRKVEKISDEISEKAEREDNNSNYLEIEVFVCQHLDGFPDDPHEFIYINKPDGTYGALRLCATCLAHADEGVLGRFQRLEWSIRPSWESKRPVKN